MRRVIPILLSRPGVAEAAGHFVWLAADKLIRFGLNVMVGFWVARYLGPVEFGTLSYVIAVVGVVGLAGELGLEAVLRREIIARPDAAADLITSAATLRAGGAILGYGALAALAASGVVAAPPVVVVIIGLMVFQPAVGFADSWFQARLAGRTLVLVQLAALSAGALARILAIRSGASLVVFAWITALEALAAAGLLSMAATRRGLRLGRFRSPLAAALMKAGWPLLLSGAAVMLYLRIDALMLRHYAGEAAVGLYAAAIRFSEIWYFVPIALASSVLPGLLRSREEGAGIYSRRIQQYYDANTALAYGISIPIALLAPVLVRAAYGEAYAAAAPLVWLHVWSTLFVFLGVARTQFLVNEGHLRFYLGSTVAGLAINVALNLVLIPSRGPMGAVIATLVAQACATWLSSFFYGPVRATAWMQARALLIPFRCFRYVRAR